MGPPSKPDGSPAAHTDLDLDLVLDPDPDPLLLWAARGQSPSMVLPLSQHHQYWSLVCPSTIYYYYYTIMTQWHQAAENHILSSAAISMK